MVKLQKESNHREFEDQIQELEESSSDDSGSEAKKSTNQINKNSPANVQKLRSFPSVNDSAKKAEEFKSPVKNT